MNVKFLILSQTTREGGANHCLDEVHTAFGLECNSYRKGMGSGEPCFLGERGKSISCFARKDKWIGVMISGDGQKTIRGARGGERGKRGENWIKGCKERGEWAELCFMARAAGLGMGVLKPFGDSLRFDVGVVSGERIWKVQVKSTIYCRRGNEYSLNMMGPGRKMYRPGTVDFFAVYLIPVNQWYIIPYGAMGKKLTVHFTPGGKRQKYARYLEAWELLESPGVNVDKSATFRMRQSAPAD